jgi:putative nucleotidyltransferase with HDIG domain
MNISFKDREQFFRELAEKNKQLVELKKTQSEILTTSNKIKRDRDIHSVMSALLKMSLENTPLEEMLRKSLDLILSIPWLVLKPKGAIFLVNENDPETLVMKVHTNLGSVIPEICRRVPFGKCMCGLAAASGKVQFSSCLDERHKTTYNGIMPHGHYCTPIAFAGKTIGVINLYVKEGHRRDALEEYFLTTIANTLAGILDRRQTHQELANALEKLRKGMGATIQAIAATVETRDPYTAGHQKRVANIARAIGTQMNLPPDAIDAIRIAGAIHDIGKLSVPLEILSKPGKITDMEFAIIKEHSQTGYRILKDIDFPWPIAQIVLQHHERVDGSGYPQQLRHEEILLEARIIGVADVVEAIASHRPYRSALGIDKALDEISKDAGTHFDPIVVDACLTIFREKKFILEQKIAYGGYMDWKI